MKNNTLLLSVFLSLLIISCKETDNEYDHANQADFESQMNKIQVDFTDVDALRFSSIIKRAKYIKLESVDSSLISGIRKIMLSPDRIFVQTPTDLIVFNDEGNYINKINRRGKGPGEYLLLTDTWLDLDENTINILDGRLGKTITFSWDFNYLSEFMHGVKGLSFFMLNRDNFFIYNGNDIASTTDYKLVYYEGKDLTNSFFKIDLNEATYLHIFENNNFYNLNNRILFRYNLNDTVYHLTPHKAIPRLAIDFGENKITPEVFDNKYSDIAEFINYVRKQGFAFGHYGFSLTSKYIFFICEKDKELYFVLHDKKAEETKVYDSFIDDVTYAGREFNFTFDHIFEANTDSSVLLSVQPYEFLSIVDSIKIDMSPSEWTEYTNNNEEIMDLYESTSYDDNPILFEYFLY